MTPTKRELISKKTRYEFREYFVGTTIREIQAAFDAADISWDSNYAPDVTGQRRYLVEQYYHSIDWTKWPDIQRVLSVFENVLIEIGERMSGDDPWAENAKHQQSSLQRWLEKDGFEFVRGRLLSMGKAMPVPEVDAIATRFDLPELSRQIDRLKQAVEHDPSLAIGTAKELVETTCKSILIARNIDVDKDWDIPELVKRTRKTLKLLPEDIPDSVRGADTIRKLLSNLGSIAHGVAELRNLYGTGHGRDGKSKGLLPRHARMVAGAASTLTAFLLETHEERDS